MQIRERLLRLGDTGVPVKSALIAFQRDFNIKKLNKLNRLTIRRLHELTTGNVRLKRPARIIYSESRRGAVPRYDCGRSCCIKLIEPKKNPKNNYRCYYPALWRLQSSATATFGLKPSSLPYRAARAALRGIDPSQWLFIFLQSG